MLCNQKPETHCKRYTYVNRQHEKTVKKSKQVWILLKKSIFKMIKI